MIFFTLDKYLSIFLNKTYIIKCKLISSSLQSIYLSYLSFMFVEKFILAIVGMEYYRNIESEHTVMFDFLHD